MLSDPDQQIFPSSVIPTDKGLNAFLKRAASPSRIKRKWTLPVYETLSLETALMMKRIPNKSFPVEM